MHDLPGQESASPIPFQVGDHSLLTAEEAAAILRVPRSWVYSHLNLLPVVRMGRYVRFRRRGIDRIANGSDEADGAVPCA
jgi:excisionase family DNA binding protein